MALGLLAADAEFAPGARLFERGGLAFSPILHGRSAFETLDSQYDRSSIPRAQDFLTLDWKNVWALLHVGIPLNWQNLITLYNRSPPSFTARFYNQFHHDLADARTAVGFRKIRRRGYYATFVAEGYAGRTVMSREQRDRRFDEATDPSPLLAKIDRPTLIYFSQDDPVLSGPQYSTQPTAVTQLLNKARENPSIVVFNPNFGGHTGALLDPIFEDLIKAILKPEAP